MVSTSQLRKLKAREGYMGLGHGNGTGPWEGGARRREEGSERGDGGNSDQTSRVTGRGFNASVLIFAWRGGGLPREMSE